MYTFLLGLSFAFGDSEPLSHQLFDFDRDLRDGAGDTDLSATTEPAEPRGLREGKAFADDEAAVSIVLWTTG